MKGRPCEERASRVLLRARSGGPIAMCLWRDSRRRLRGHSPDMGELCQRASEHLPRGARVCRSLGRRSHAGPESETRSGEEGVAAVVCSGDVQRVGDARYTRLAAQSRS